MIVGNKRVLVTEFKNEAIHCEAFTDRLTMVLETLNSGYLSDSAHGSDSHRAALIQVIETAQAIVFNIDRDEEDQVQVLKELSHGAP